MSKAFAVTEGESVSTITGQDLTEAERARLRRRIFWSIPVWAAIIALAVYNLVVHHSTYGMPALVNGPLVVGGIAVIWKEIVRYRRLSSG